jgi:glycosyltransferase involved in cell wall biosynthesis
MPRKAAVSVVIPCRNMARFLPEAIRSVLAQGDAITEILVVDDKSTDDPRTILAPFGPVVRVLDGPGLGSAIARNIGILHARGQLIAFLDADDVWLPGKIDAQIESLRSTGAGLSFTDWAHCVATSDPLESALAHYTCVTQGDAFSALLRENFLLTSAVVVRREVFASAGLFKQRLRGGQDFELWLRIARVTGFAYVPTLLAAKRRHGDNITLSYDYPVLHTRVWDEIRASHNDVSRADLHYIRQRQTAALSDAGRHLLRHGDVESARSFLARAAGTGDCNLQRVGWAAISRLPRPVILQLLNWRRRSVVKAPTQT